LHDLVKRGLLAVALIIMATLFWRFGFAYEQLGYEPLADPDQQLSVAMKKAQAEDKWVLLIGGGDWCTWCWHLNEILHDNETVKSELEQAFVVQKIYWRQPSLNEAFAARFGDIGFAPFMILIDDKGKVRMAKAAADFMFDGRANRYEIKRLQQFIRYWKQRRELEKKVEERSSAA